MEDLYDRIEQGITTPEDAESYARLVARLARYELALKHVAVYGTGREAMLATRALAGGDMWQVLDDMYA